MNDSLKKAFLTESYYSESYPASVANVFRNKNILAKYINDGGDISDNIKVYVRWIRKLRNELFPNHPYKRNNKKFIQEFGVNRGMTIFEAINKHMYMRSNLRLDTY